MKKKIMIVDDEPDCLYSVKQVLEGKNGKYKVTCASSGIQCLELLKNNEIPDLILLDIMMPEMDGWSLFERLQDNPLWKNIPVIFISALTDVMEEKSEDFLTMDYIRKPFNIEDFKKRINDMFKKSRSKGH